MEKNPRSHYCCCTTLFTAAPILHGPLLLHLCSIPQHRERTGDTLLYSIFAINYASLCAIFFFSALGKKVQKVVLQFKFPRTIHTLYARINAVTRAKRSFFAASDSNDRAVCARVCTYNTLYLGSKWRRGAGSVRGEKTPRRRDQNS